MNHNPVGWFDIPVADMARAKIFYEALFGITMPIHDELPGYLMAWFPMADGAKGTSGALMQGDGYHPGPTGVVNYFTCPELEATVAKAVALGSRVVLPKKDLGQWGHIAWVTDSEGNVVGLHRRAEA